MRFVSYGQSSGDQCQKKISERVHREAETVYNQLNINWFHIAVIKFRRFVSISQNIYRIYP